MGDSEGLIVAEDAGLRFPGGIEALGGVSFAVRPGEFVSIVGPSGCGKSTLLRAVAGLERVTSGNLTVEGLAPGDARARHRSKAFVFQDATLLPWRSVEANVLLPLELLGVPADERGTRVTEALAMVGLGEFASARPAELSGGMQMRVSLARAFVTQPELLLLDEPFGALDEITRHRLNEELLALWERHGWTVLSITHSVFEAVFLSSRVFVMSPRPGRIVADVPVPLPFPRNRETRSDPAYLEVVAAVDARLRESLA